MDATQQKFIDDLQAHQISLTSAQLEQFDMYYRTLVEWNEKMNLTAITEREQVYTKHFFDSLSLSFFYDVGQVSTLADIGSGAGFPSIPLKIAFPHLRITIVDSLNKRISFLRELVSLLNLEQVDCVHGRAEDIARFSEHRDKYDLVTARAVARLSVLNEFCLPFVKKGGAFLSMKGSDIDDEVSEAAYSISELKGKLVKVDRMVLPGDQSVRHFIQIRKDGVTPAKYPRKAGVPLKSPLVK